MVEDLKTLRAQPDAPTQGEIPIYVTKSNYFRVIHADGIYGGGTPTPGNIMMTFFNHRVPFPERLVRESSGGGEIRSKRTGKYGVEQEFEVGIVVSIETAKIMLTWLDGAIKNAEENLRQNNLGG